MADIRTYLKTSGKQGTAFIARVDAERVRVNWRDSSGRLITSQVMPDAEATALAGMVEEFLPEPDPPSPPPVPGPTSEMPEPTGALVFSDDFDSLDQWALYNGPGHAGNGLRVPDAWSIAPVEGATGNGKAAVCTARWDAAAGKVRSGGMSARQRGADGIMRKFLQKGGRWESRCRFDADPAGRMSGLFMLWPDNALPNPEGRRINLVYGELNIIETGHAVTAHRNPCYGYMHWPNAADGSKQTRFVYPVNADEWHTWTLDWVPGKSLVVYCDGKKMGEERDPAKVPVVPFTATCQLDCFSNAQIPTQRAYFDYVKVWASA